MRIPTGNFGNATPSPQPTRVSVGNAGAMGQALQHLSTVGIQVAEGQQQRIDQEDQSQLQAVTLQLDEFSNGLVNDPNHGLLSLQGTNAEGATDKYISQFEQYANTLAADIPERLIGQFKNQADARRIQLARTGLSFENAQRKQVEESNFRATVNNSKSRAPSYFNDNISYQMEVGSTKQLIAEYGRAHGWTDEQVAEEQFNFVNEAALKTSEQEAYNNPSGFLSAAGEPSDVGGANRASGGAQVDPRGIRNNNPGNLVRTDNTWNGEVNGNDSRFASFATPEHGLRALCKNLLTYNKRGYSTVGQIVERWAPPSENDTASYTAALSKALGVSADQELDLTDINTLMAMCEGITQHENGSNPYSKDQVAAGAMAALGIRELPRPDGTPLRRSGTTTAAIQLNPKQLAQLRSVANDQLSQQQAEFRAELDGKVKDAEAAYYRGVEVSNPPSQQEFTQAYGYNQGARRYDQLQQTQRLGADIAAVQQLPYTSQVALLEARKPVEGDGYADAVQRYDTLQKAVSYVNTARQADPIQYAVNQEQAKPLDLTDPTLLAKGLTQRANSLTDISQQYGTPLTVFTKQEAAQLTSLFQEAPASQQLTYLDTMRQSIGDSRMYMAALQQVSEGAPSAAIAGILMDKSGDVVAQRNWFSPNVKANPYDAAKTILEGNIARKGEEGSKGIPMPKETDTRLAFSNYVGDAFAGDSGGAETAYQIALDYYAGMNARKGGISGALDEELFKQSIAVSTGGIANYNEQGKIMLPWGMSEDNFDSAIRLAWKNQVANRGIKAGHISLYGLQSKGDSRYLVKSGTGYLLDNEGIPVELDLLEPKIRFIRGIPQ